MSCGTRIGLSVVGFTGDELMMGGPGMLLLVYCDISRCDASVESRRFD